VSRRARFRTRLLAALVLVAVLPLLLLGLLASQLLGGLLGSVSFAPVEEVLERAEASAPNPAIAEGRLLLAEAELARRSLSHLAPWVFAAALALAAAASAGAALALGRAFSRPIDELAGGMAKLAGGALDEQLPVRGDPSRDELAFVVDRFNRMAAELADQRRRLEVTQRLAAWQEVARAMAHELKNPLTAMKMALARIARLEAARGEAEQARLAESAALLDEQVDVLMRMAQSFSELAKMPPADPRPLSLRPLLNEVCALYRTHGSVGVALSPGQDARVRADADQLRRAFANLVKNAVEASAEGAPAVEVALAAAEGRVRITVRDRGQGISRPISMGQFVEGGSRKPGGSGLGLPITQKILHEHGGSLRLEPAEGGGTLATAELPLDGAEAS